MTIELPWPPATLSGHANGNSHWKKSSATAKHRKWAKDAAQAARLGPFPGSGDIHIIMAFFPPDRRSDRVNFPNRAKPYWDGIADALGVNDRRFLPSFVFGEPVAGGKVIVEFPA